MAYTGTDCATFWDINALMDNCYQFNFLARLSWSEARTSCQQQGADLLSITKVEEQIFINGLLTGYSATLWMGLNDLDLNGGWQWADSAPLKYLNWEAEMPSYDEEEDCGVISTNAQGRWHNRDCSVPLPYICKKRPNTTLHPFTTDIEELWIGLHDTAMQMNFEWTDRTPVIFTYWHPFEPNNFRNVNEDCVTIRGPEGRWSDSPCNYSLPSICKKAAQKADERIEDHGCKW
ncbi:hypothetical protein cypCar_00046669, partial [Cyprinus carpio]